MSPHLALAVPSRSSQGTGEAGRRLEGRPQPTTCGYRQDPLATTLELLGGRWRSLIVWHLFWEPKPFGELMRRTEGITKRTLRRELAEMESAGLVSKEVRYRADRRPQYSLTPFGQTLKPIVAMMYEWGLRRRTGPRALTAGAGRHA